MDADELRDRFAYHPPRDDLTREMHEVIRDLCGNLAQGLNGGLPEGREKALAITNLEQVMFWANAAVARATAT